MVRKTILLEISVLDRLKTVSKNRGLKVSSYIRSLIMSELNKDEKEEQKTRLMKKSIKKR